MKQVYNISVNLLKYIPTKALELLFPKTCRRCAVKVNRQVEICDPCVERRKNFLSEVIF